ncbi:MAG: RNA polymerase factor sigma-54 [Thermoanaerobaculia bacterium]
MALEQKLQLRLAQKLVMTPSLQQAIKLLQMTRMEVQTTVTNELVENPVLEEGDFEESATSDEEAETPEETEAEKDPMEDIDFEAYFSDYLDGGPGLASGSRIEHREAPPLEATLSREPDLYDHLLWQLHMAEVPDRLREIAELIVGNLDPDGFLVASPEEIRSMGDGIPGESGYSLEEVEQALGLVRDLDPPGIGFGTLSECLLRQFDAQGEPDDSPVRRVVEDYWDLFLKRQFPTLAKKLGLELADLEPIVEKIKTLQTRPGRRFNSDRAQYVEPDVYVVKVSGDYVIQINDDGLPKLRINRAYRRMLQAVKSDAGEVDAKNFIREKLRSALWLIKSLDQRQRTIYKVADSIVRQQRDFLDHGIDRLRPMVLRDVADDIGMHESTVSRVVSNKYMHTPRGVYPMKFFFHSGIERDYGGDISSLTVKGKIRQLIEKEDEKRPLSDSELTRILKREGINIARRTVAKYRDELSIPSSTHRKKVF